MALHCPAHMPEVGQGDALTRVWTLDKTSPICHNDQPWTN